MIDREFALEFTGEWISAWNSHDLDRILAHYADDFEMSSPYIVQLMDEASGTLKGKDAIRRYWTRALALPPPLKFELEQVYIGVDSITIQYRRAGTGRRAAEVLFFNEQRQVVRGVAHYA